MQATLLKLLCQKNNLTYIVFDTNFLVKETNIENLQLSCNIFEYLWELVGLEDEILALTTTQETLNIPMVLRNDLHYDLEISSFKNISDTPLLIAILQQKSSYSQEYAEVLKQINKKTLVYELSDEKKQNNSLQEINKHLITFHVDLDGHITMVNEAALYFFNLEKSEMIGNHFSTYLHPQKSKRNTSNIFISQNTAGKNIFFYADIIPLTNSEQKVYENIIVAQDITHLKKIKYELEFAQEHDTLTGLGNRHCFLKMLDKKIEKDEEFFICFIDVDRFHLINEEYGAHAADMLLKHISTLLLDFIEADDVVMRLHADCFVILFETGKNTKYIEAVVQKLHTLFIENPLHYNNEDIIHFSCSDILLGYPHDIKESKEVLHLAQKLLQRKKISSSIV